MIYSDTPCKKCGGFQATVEVDLEAKKRYFRCENDGTKLESHPLQYRDITISEVDDIIWAHRFMNCLSEYERPYYEWWFHEVSTGQIKVPPPPLNPCIDDGEVWTPPELRRVEIPAEDTHITRYRERLSTEHTQREIDAVLNLTSKTNTQDMDTEPEVVLPEDEEMEETATEAAPVEEEAA